MEAEELSGRVLGLGPLEDNPSFDHYTALQPIITFYLASPTLFLGKFTQRVQVVHVFLF